MLMGNLADLHSFEDGRIAASDESLALYFSAYYISLCVSAVQSAWLIAIGQGKTIRQPWPQNLLEYGTGGGLIRSDE